MDQYRIEFYKNGEEIKISEVPEEYLNGIIQACRGEISSRERMKRVFRKMGTKEIGILHDRASGC